MNLRRRCLLVVSVLVAIALPAPTASAHSLLVRSEPASGTTLAESPGLAKLWFSEDVTLSRSSARLIDGSGSVVPGTRPIMEAGNPRGLAIALPKLQAGTYGLVWQVMSAEDGHTASGTVVFGIGSLGSQTFASTSGTGESGLLRRWAGLVALAGVIGPLALSLVVLRRRRGVLPPINSAITLARRRLLSVVVAAALLAFALRWLDLVVELRRDSSGVGKATGVLRDTPWGHLWIAAEALLLLAALLALALRTDAPGLRRPLTWATGTALVGLIWVQALGSHAQSVTDGRLAALLALAAHAFAGLVWMGAVPALVVVLWPSGRLRPHRADLVRVCRTPFSVLATGSVGVVIVTGLYGAGVEVTTVESLVTTTYGRLLLLKTALLVAIGGLGLINAGRLRSLAGTTSNGQRLAGLIAVEAGVGLVLLAAVGALVGQPPPLTSPAAAAEVTEQLDQARTGTVDDLVVTVSATPNRPGANWFTVLTESTRRPAPGAIDSVTLRITAPDGSRQLPLQPLTAGRYFTTYRADSASPLRLSVLIQRAGRRYTVDLAWPMAPVGQAPSTTHGRRLAPYVDAAALALLEVAVAAGAWWLLRSGRRRVAPAVPGQQDELVKERSR